MDWLNQQDAPVWRQLINSQDGKRNSPHVFLWTTPFSIGNATGTCSYCHPCRCWPPGTSVQVLDLEKAKQPIAVFTPLPPMRFLFCPLTFLSFHHERFVNFFSFSDFGLLNFLLKTSFSGGQLPVLSSLKRVENQRHKISKDKTRQKNTKLIKKRPWWLLDFDQEKKKFSFFLQAETACCIKSHLMSYRLHCTKR